MYSPLYEYFEIKSDENHTEQKPISEIVKILKDTHLLKETENYSFCNVDDFPWINISCIIAVNGNYSTSYKPLKFANLITITTAKENDKNTYINLLKDISAQLGWQLYMEGDEEENILIS